MSGCIAHNGRMTSDKRAEEMYKQAVMTSLKYHRGTFLAEIRNTTKRINNGCCVPAEVQTANLQNTTQGA
jgi:hypothetical protein